MERVGAAKSVSPGKWPQKIPSRGEYRALANMLAAPGREARKKSFRGCVFVKSSIEFISVSSLSGIMLLFFV